MIYYLRTAQYIYWCKNFFPPPKHERRKEAIPIARGKSTVPTFEDYESMTKEELIQEIIRAKINEERAKKGYAVKGVGAQKEYILLDSRNTKS